MGEPTIEDIEKIEGDKICLSHDLARVKPSILLRMRMETDTS